MCIFYRVLMIGKHSLLVKFSGKIRFSDSSPLLRDNCYRRQTTSVMMERVRFVFVLTCIHNTHVSALDIQGYNWYYIQEYVRSHMCLHGMICTCNRVTWNHGVIHGMMNPTISSAMSRLPRQLPRGSWALFM